MLPNTKEKRLFKRIRVEAEIDVAVRSFGSQHPYKFKTGNISAGGVFIRTDEKTQVPFSPQSILEISLQFSGFMQEKVDFVAKIAHITKGKGFGVKITQIDDRSQALLEKYVNHFIQNYPDLIIR
ncbi:MAG: PilZ domain-containing protein [Oligoflexales bacterium]